MSHDAHPNPNLQDDPASSPLVVGSVLGTLVTVAVIVLLAALYYQEERKFTQALYYERPEMQVQQLYAQQHADLATYRWIKPDEKTPAKLGIPIEQAMKWTLDELAQGRPGQFALPAASAPANGG